MTNQQACAKIIGQLHRVGETITDRKNMISATLKYVSIACANGYNIKPLAECAFKAFLSTNN